MPLWLDMVRPAGILIMYIVQHSGLRRHEPKEFNALQDALFYAVTYAYYQRDTAYIYGNNHRAAIATVTVNPDTTCCIVHHLDEKEFPVPN